MDTAAFAAQVRAEINRLQKVLNLLESDSTGSSGRGRRKGTTMSAEARARISAAQKARWAKARKGKKAE